MDRVLFFRRGQKERERGGEGGIGSPRPSRDGAGGRAWPGGEREGGGGRGGAKTKSRASRVAPPPPPPRVRRPDERGEGRPIRPRARAACAFRLRTKRAIEGRGGAGGRKGRAAGAENRARMGGRLCGVWWCKNRPKSSRRRLAAPGAGAGADAAAGRRRLPFLRPAGGSPGPRSPRISCGCGWEDGWVGACLSQAASNEGGPLGTVQ